MEKLLIEIYLFVCHIYDTSSKTCYQNQGVDTDFVSKHLSTFGIGFVAVLIAEKQFARACKPGLRQQN